MLDGAVIGVFNDLQQAESAVRRLGELRFPIRKVAIVVKELRTERVLLGYVTASDLGKRGALYGALIGAFVAFLMSSIQSWTVGPEAALELDLINGLLQGVLVGGVLGFISGYSVGRRAEKQKIIRYKDQTQGGKFLLISHATNEDIGDARELLNEFQSTVSTSSR